MRFKVFDSLRNRYIFMALILMVLMIAGSYVGYQSVSTTRQETNINLDVRSDLIKTTSNIRNRLLDAYKTTDLFLLEPSNKQYQNKVYQSLDRAYKLAQRLDESHWVQENYAHETVLEIKQLIEQLKQAANQLLLTRLDTNRQYPAMAVGNNVLGPNRNAVNNAFAVAFNELDTENVIGSNPQVYSDYLTARRLWMQTLSNFRLYLANRVGSFNEKSLPTQESAIETMYLELEASLQKLMLRAEKDQLGFEASDALQTIINSSARWYRGYLQIKEIHKTGKWRKDAEILQEKISPLLSRISLLLSIVEENLSSSAAQDMQSLGNVAYNQTLILWIVAISAIIFITLVIIFSQRLVFKPIAEVSQALKAEAFGKRGVLRTASRSRETRDLVEAFNEMSKQVRHRQAALEYQALHDSLTSLPNRTLLTNRMEHEIQLARREQRQFALLMIDLDRFKEVNDTLGHQVGDYLLVEVGARLQSQLREVDTIARLGGDEFAVLLPDCSEEKARHVADKICQSMDASFHINELNIVSMASIGISLYPIHGTDVQNLLQHADVAMYLAKRNKSGYAVYDADLDEHSVTRLSLIDDLRHAINNNLLEIHYQPKIDLSNNKISGVEALLRWQHPAYGAIPPEEIITLAEQTGLINNLCAWILDKVARQYRQWQEQGLHLNSAINLSVQNLRDNSLIETVGQIRLRHKLPDHALTLEITESAMMSNPQFAIETLSKLVSMGVDISIDDFGTGFSSLSYLKQLPVKELKIDKSFIIDMPKDESDAVIVRSTIDLAHNLDLNVVAEGVESETAWDMLRQFGCNDAQGYFISQPLPAVELQAWIEEKNGKEKQLATV